MGELSLLLEDSKNLLGSFNDNSTNFYPLAKKWLDDYIKLRYSPLVLTSSKYLLAILNIYNQNRLDMKTLNDASKLFLRANAYYNQIVNT